MPARINKASVFLLALTLPLLTTHAEPPSGNWQYFWGDDFSGTSVDTGKWHIGYPDWGMSTAAPTAVDNSKVKIGDGILTLEATRTKVNGSDAAGDENFAGGLLSTYQKHTFSPADNIYIEARILLPSTPGTWPAFWGLQDGWPPEVDIMEYPLDTAAGSGYNNDQYHTALHYDIGSGAQSTAGQANPGNAGDLRGAYHNFGLFWRNDTFMRFYFDEVESQSTYNGAAVADMDYTYLILNHAVGSWPGMPNTTEWPVGFTDQMRVDWVRVWKAVDAKTTNWTDASGLSTDWKAWENNGFWDNGEPNLGGVTANFDTLAGISERLIDVVQGGNGNRIASIINLDGATRYRIGWPTDRLVLGPGNSGAIQPAINVAASTATDHEFWIGLEWAGTLAINNDSSHPLLLTGSLKDGDQLNINGPGVVSFDGDSTGYDGTIVIDSGGAGPGIARATSPNALGSGFIVIGETGNATTGRLELENGAALPNPISLNGRNNSSAGIVNNSGSNSISGTISSQVGGSNYWIQSDAGNLLLSGNSGDGVAIRSTSGGTRTFTLKGAGDGTVSGVIENGNATVNLVKDDAGTWTLGQTNTYSGTTTINGGTLVVNGSTGSGTTTMASGTTLSGGGAINGNLTAPTGSTVRAGIVGFPLVSPSPFTLLEDFDSYDNSVETKTTVATGGVWKSEFDGTNNSHIVDSDQGQSLQTLGGAAWRGAERDLTGTEAAVLVDETQTYFWQVKASSTGGAYDFMMGLSQSVGNIDSVDAWQDFNVMPFVNNAAATPYINAEAPTTPWWAAMNTDAWYNVWVVIDNDATTPTYDLYYSLGAGAPILVAENANWRNTGPLPVGNALNAIGFMAAGGAGSTLLVDNIYYAPGEELDNPLDFVSAPLVPEAATLNVTGNLVLAAGSTLEFDVSSGSLHDKLVVDGTLTASGVLKVTLDPGQPAPVLGDSFDLFDATTSTISFSSFDLPALPPELAWDTSAIDTGVLSVVEGLGSYWTWASTIAFPPGLDSPELNADGGLATNVFEFLNGTDPLDPSDDQLPAMGFLEGGGNTFLTLTARLRKDREGITVFAEGAETLTGLDEPGAAANTAQAPPVPDGEFESILWLYTVPIGDDNTGFLRLKAVTE